MNRFEILKINLNKMTNPPKIGTIAWAKEIVENGGSVYNFYLGVNKLSYFDDPGWKPFLTETGWYIAR